MYTERSTSRYFAQGKEQYTVEVRSEIFITTLYFLNKIIQHTFEFTRRYIAFFCCTSTTTDYQGHAACYCA